MVNSKDLKEIWEQDGCLVLPKYLKEHELQELEEHTESYLEAINYRSKSSAGKKFPGVIKNLNAQDPWFKDLLLNGPHIELLQDLLQDDLEPATAAYFERKIGDLDGINPHIDAIGHRRMGATLWIPLDRADTENGCMFYERGSHKVAYADRVDIQGYVKDKKEVFAVELDPGDASIHSTLTVHWSGANESHRQRRAVSFFYWAKNSVGSYRKSVNMQKKVA